MPCLVLSRRSLSQKTGALLPIRLIKKDLCTLYLYQILCNSHPIRFELMISASSRHYCSKYVRRCVGVPSDAETNYAFAPSPQSPPPSFFVKYPKSSRLEPNSDIYLQCTSATSSQYLSLSQMRRHFHPSELSSEWASRCGSPVWDSPHFPALISLVRH